MEIQLEQQCEGCERTTCYHCNLCPHPNADVIDGKSICGLCEKEIEL